MAGFPSLQRLGHVGEKSIVMSTSQKNIHVAVLAYGNRSRELGLVLDRLESLGIERIVVIANCVSQSVLNTIQSHALRGRTKIDSRNFTHNIGSAGGYSEAIRAAFCDPSCNAVWLLDDDNLPAPDCFGKLLEAYRLTGISIPTLLACRRPSLPEMQRIDPTQWQRHPARGSCIGFNLINILRRLRSPPLLEIDPSGLIPLAWTVYGGLLLPRAVFNTGELPMESLHLYGDDMEWTARLSRNGFRIMLVPEARIDDLQPPWSAAGETTSNLLRRICYLDDHRVYFEARNRNWLALTAFKGNALLYRLNRSLYLLAALIIAVRYQRIRRFRLLRQAIRDAELGKLGDCLPGKLGAK